MPADRRHLLGWQGETVAEQAAVARGWTPWLRRYRVAGSEIDLGLRRQTATGLALLLLEVKTATTAHDDLASRWTARQQGRLWRAAGVLAEREQASSVEVALVIVVLGHDHSRVQWLPAEPF
jgi:Holliday junction resolvase-like predicted endonuclease